VIVFHGPRHQPRCLDVREPRLREKSLTDKMCRFSARNLKYIRAFFKAWPEEPIVQQLAAQIPWFHNCLLLDKVSEPSVRTWHVQQTIEHGWNRNVLVYIPSNENPS
jgi:predicted nuclease of restriction endonuclease-like (RecB) superfamily